MLTSLRYPTCMAAFGAIASISNLACAEYAISNEIIRKYEEAGGIPYGMSEPKEGELGKDNDLPGGVPGFVFTAPPTGELPAISVPCGLTLYRHVFYSRKPREDQATGADLTPFRHIQNLTYLKLELEPGLFTEKAEKSGNHRVTLCV